MSGWLNQTYVLYWSFVLSCSRWLKWLVCCYAFLSEHDLCRHPWSVFRSHDSIGLFVRN